MERLRFYKALIVDDDMIVLKELAEYLGNIFGFICQASNGIEALYIAHDSLMENSIKVSSSCDENTFIIGYIKELQQALLNIINNAKDALVEKNIKNKIIIIKVISSENEIKIDIQDNGGGINNSIKDKIFKPYFTTKHKSKGTGVGLYMTKSIIEKHFDGRIYCENIKNGTRFTIILPKK